MSLQGLRTSLLALEEPPLRVARLPEKSLALRLLQRPGRTQFRQLEEICLSLLARRVRGAFQSKDAAALGLELGSDAEEPCPEGVRIRRRPGPSGSMALWA